MANMKWVERRAETPEEREAKANRLREMQHKRIEIMNRIYPERPDFIRNGDTLGNYTPKMAKACSCGRLPKTEVAIDCMDNPDGPLRWLTICHECHERTPEADSPEASVEMWNSGKRTAATLVMRKPLTLENVDDFGIQNLISGLARSVAADYMAAIRAAKKRIDEGKNVNPDIVEAVENGLLKNRAEAYLESTRKKERKKRCVATPVEKELLATIRADEAFILSSPMLLGLRRSVTLAKLRKEALRDPKEVQAEREAIRRKKERERYRRVKLDNRGRPRKNPDGEAENDETDHSDGYPREERKEGSYSAVV